MEEPIESPVTRSPQDEINDLMAGYTSKPMEVLREENTKEKVEETEEKTDIPISINDPAPYGRYVSGVKKGQPRSKPGGGKIEEKSTVSGMLIDGAMFLMLIDLIFPLVICIINNKLSGQEIKPDELKLKDYQKKELGPLCERVMNQLSLTGNPTTILIISLIGVYGMNFMMVKMEKSK